jgi:ATP-dependent RNA helicase DDX27
MRYPTEPLVYSKRDFFEFFFLLKMDPLLIKTIEEEEEFSQNSESAEESMDEGFEFDEFTPINPIIDTKHETRNILQERIEFYRKNAAKEDSVEGNTDEDESLAGEESDEEEDTEIQKTEQELDDIVQDKRKAMYFDDAPPEKDTDDVDAFTALSISRPILKAIAKLGFVKPTDIQSKTIPLALQGRDICGSAITGSGKTAAFMIPILERLLFRPKSTPAIRVLVLVPTRELGAQCFDVCLQLSLFCHITACLCVGGLSSKQQEAELKKKPDVLIATPGRLIDHIHNSLSFSLDDIEILVIDEADRILEDGFKAELEEIIKYTPVKRQTMLFSATMTDNIDELIRLSLKRPVRLFVDNAQSMTSKLVQEFIRVRGHKEESRPAILAALCSRTYKSETIVFFRSKAAAHHMRILFGLIGLKAAELHGNLTQPQVFIINEAFGVVGIVQREKSGFSVGYRCCIERVGY